MDRSICLRCSGKVLRDYGGNESCANCGWEAVYSIPLDATPNNFHAYQDAVTGNAPTRRRQPKLQGSSNKPSRESVESKTEKS